MKHFYVFLLSWMAVLCHAQSDSIIGVASNIVLTVDGMSFYVPEKEYSDSLVAESPVDTFVAEVLPDSAAKSTASHEEPIRKKCPFREKWHVTEMLSFVLNHGNDENLKLKNTGSLVRNDSLVSLDLNYKFVYETKKKEETEKNLKAMFKLDFWQYQKWSPFVALEYMTNKYKGYDNKLSGLLGAKRRIYSKPKVCDYSVSLAFTCDWVDYTPEKTRLDNIAYRLSLRPKMKQKLGESASLKFQMFYQPSLTNFSDYILSADFSIDCRIRRWFSIEFSVEDDYHSKIPADVYEHNDLSTEVGLKFSF